MYALGNLLREYMQYQKFIWVEHKYSRICQNCNTGRPHFHDLDACASLLSWFSGLNNSSLPTKRFKCLLPQYINCVQFHEEEILLRAIQSKSHYVKTVMTVVSLLSKSAHLLLSLHANIKHSVVLHSCLSAINSHGII